MAKLIATQQQKLQTAEQTPELQKIIDKTANQTQTQENQAVEDNRKKPLDIFRTFDRIKRTGNVITDGSHMENGKLKPNVTYQTGEHAYYYSTNSEGLISTVFVEDLQPKVHDGRLSYNRNTYGKRKGDHAGHLIGDQFGGSPELDNLVSQAALVNLSKYKMLEGQWSKAIQAGQKVSVGISVNYETNGTRPTSFAIEFAIDGVCEKIQIDNE